MSKARFNCLKPVALCAVLVAAAWSVSASGATAPAQRAGVLVTSDLSGEARTLDTYVKDLLAFDKKAAEYNKAGALSQLEFEALQRQGEDLKRRLSGVQNALREVVRKLKASGDWDDLDSKLLATVTDAKVRSLFQQGSFKAELEAAASQLSDGTREISVPLDGLRTKISVRQEPLFERDASGLELRFVRASYGPAAADGKFRCRMSWLRYGISKAVRPGPDSPDDVSSINCFCFRQCGTPSDPVTP